MSRPSLQRHLMVWVLGALCAGALMLAVAAYGLALHETDEVLDDSLRQTALLLADRDLSGMLLAAPTALPLASADTESKLVAIARRPDGTLLFTSEPQMALRFDAVAGASVQPALGEPWHVYSVVQPDRVVQVAQPVAVRQESAREMTAQLLGPLVALIAVIGVLLVVALRRGMQPLRMTTTALAARSATSLAPLDLQRVPTELMPLMGTLDDLLARIAAAFAVQRHFVADAAHELRSPITALQLQVQLLERSADPAERTAATAELAAGIARARRLIEQLLYLSRTTADHIADDSAPALADDGRLLVAHVPVPLGDLVRRVVARWSAQAERRGIDLGAEEQHSASVHGDPEQIEMLLGNLVENALRYTPAGGVVDVIAGEVDGRPALRVIDNGPGIPEAERERVFDRFYRSPQAIAGTMAGAAASAEVGSGLGLAIVKAIAARHGAVVTLGPGPGGVGLDAVVVFEPTTKGTALDEPAPR